MGNCVRRETGLEITDKHGGDTVNLDEIRKRIVI